MENNKHRQYGFEIQARMDDEKDNATNVLLNQYRDLAKTLENICDIRRSGSCLFFTFSSGFVCILSSLSKVINFYMWNKIEGQNQIYIHLKDLDNESILEIIYKYKNQFESGKVFSNVDKYKLL